jgi:hypothetical protein
MGAEKLGFKSDSGNPFRDKPRVLACRHATALSRRLVNRNSLGFLPNARR